MKKRLLFVIPALLGLFLSSCGGGGGDSPAPTDDPSEEKEPEQPTDPTKSNFTGVVFESATYTYDGQPHILAEVTGAPENTTSKI